MKRLVFSLAWAFALLLACSLVSGAVVEHTFNVWALSFFSFNFLSLKYIDMDRERLAHT